MRLFLDLRTKRILILGGVAAMGMGLLWALWPKPVAVEVTKLGRGALLVSGRGGRQDTHQGHLHGIGTHHRETGTSVPGGWRSCEEGYDNGCDYRAHGAGLS